MNKKFQVALIGVGGRGEGLYRVALKFRTDCEFVAVCDPCVEKCEYVANNMVKDERPRPAIYTDYKTCIDEQTLDAVVVATGWDMHIPITTYAMEKGVAVACEVGGGYSMQNLWELVRCYERTKTPVMMLENCCYGKLELLALNMARKGLLGEIVHCEGAYRHDLSDELLNGGRKHYRLQQYVCRNSDNYPTHDVGPIAKLLNINAGNRFLSLYSLGSKSVGLNHVAKKKGMTEYENVKFNQSDVVDTLIKCANGETVRLTLDTSLHRYYSRDFMVQGTEGVVNEQNRSVFLKKDFPDEIWEWKEQFNNVEKYYEQYCHPIWENYHPGKEGHGGMDVLVFNGFFDALREGKPMPIDVYDYATWACISILSEQSLATGQAVAFPDFTDGKWIERENHFGE